MPQQPKNPPLRARTQWVLAVLFAVVWFALLGYRGLAEPDEGRYAEIPREMLSSGDWTTPRLNGFKYFEKPVFQYWMTAATFKLLGESNFSARLWVALIAFLGGLWVMYVGTRLWGREAGFSGFLVLLSSALYVVLGHFVTLDMTLSVFLTIGVGALLLAQADREQPLKVRNWMLVGWAALALAVLTKGLVGLVLPGGAIVIYSLWQRDWVLWRNLHIGKGLLLLLLISSPWFIAVSMANPEFPEFFFIHEHFDRYTSDVHKRDQPMWFFLPVLLAGMLPWLGSGIRLLTSSRFRWLPESSSGFDAQRFLWSLVLFTLLFFSLGRSMLPAYILPVYPALALLIGRQLALGTKLSGDISVLFIMGGLALAAAGGIHLFASEKLPLVYLQHYRYWLIAAAAVMMAGAVLIRRSGVEGWRGAATVSMTALFGLQLLIWGYQGLGAPRSSEALAVAVKPYVNAGAAVYGVNFYPQSLPFYLGQTIKLAITSGELRMGITREPEKWIPSWAQFHEQWQQEKQAVAVIGRKDFKRVQAGEIPGRIVYRDPQKMAVVKP